MAEARDLVDLTAAKTMLRVAGTGADTELAALITEVTDALEAEAGRQFVLRDANDVTEFHDLAVPQGFLQLRLFPVISVAGVYLGPDATDALDSSLYSIDTAGGVILMKGATANTPRTPSGPSLVARSGFYDFPEDAWRLSGRYFPGVVEGAKVVYKGGYANTAAVDGGLRQIAYDVLARIYRERERKSQGKTQEVAQGFSIASKWDPAMLSKDVKERLQRYANRSATAR